MKLHLLLGLCLVLGASCRARSAADVNKNDEAPAAAGTLPAVFEAGADEEEVALRKELSDILGQLKTINDTLATSQTLSAAEKAGLEKQAGELSARQIAIETKLKGMKDGGEAIEHSSSETDPGKQPAESTPAPTPPPAMPSSGYPSCGTTYYGLLFACGDKQCAKSDAEYKNICVVSIGAKPGDPSGYPLCGITYYGDVFGCMNGKRCAKSDAEYKNICEIGPGSKPK